MQIFPKISLLLSASKWWQNSKLKKLNSGWRRERDRTKDRLRRHEEKKLLGLFSSRNRFFYSSTDIIKKIELILAVERTNPLKQIKFFSCGFYCAQFLSFLFSSSSLQISATTWLFCMSFSSNYIAHSELQHP